LPRSFLAKTTRPLYLLPKIGRTYCQNGCQDTAKSCQELCL